MTLSAMKTVQFNWGLILKETLGFSGAQMVRAAQDAAKRIILASEETVTEEALLQSIYEHRSVK